MKEKPEGESKYAQKVKQSIEATHPHRPPVAWCAKCQQEGLTDR